MAGKGIQLGQVQCYSIVGSDPLCFLVHPGSFWSKLGFSPQVWFIRATSRNPGACADGVQMCATLFWIWRRLVVAVVTGQSWAPICLNKEAVCFVSSWKRVESVELRVAEPTRNEEIQYLLDLATRLQAHVEVPILKVAPCMAWVRGLEFQYLDVYFRHEKRVEIPFRGLIHANHYDQDTKVWEHFLSGVGNKSPPNNPKKQMTDNLWGLPFGTVTQRSGNWGFEDMIVETVSGCFRSSCGILIYFRYTDILFILWKYMVYQALHVLSVDGRCVQFNMFHVWSVPVQKQCQVLQHGACLGIGAVLGCVCLGAVCSKGM